MTVMPNVPPEVNGAAAEIRHDKNPQDIKVAASAMPVPPTLRLYVWTGLRPRDEKKYVEL